MASLHRVILEALAPDQDIPVAVLSELTSLYASHHEFFSLSGDFPDAYDIRPEQVAAALTGELAHPGVEVLLARRAGRLVGVAITLAHHPDPTDPDPWIGLLIVDASERRKGYGRELVALVEARFRRAGRDAARLAVLDNNPQGLAFWTTLGYETIGHRKDLQLGRPCAVLRKELNGTPGAGMFVLFDVDGTLIDAVANQRRVWGTWAGRYALDPDEVYRVALRTRPMETFAQVAPDRDPQECLAALHELEDDDVRSGTYTAFDGAAELLAALPRTAWALVTSNYEHRVRGRFARTGLPVPDVVVDAACVDEGKPSPVPYLLAAERLGARPRDCLVIEDAASGVRSGLRAGMTVWGVNAPVAVEGVHRHFRTLREAVPDIVDFMSGSRSGDRVRSS